MGEREREEGGAGHGRLARPAIPLGDETAPDRSAFYRSAAAAALPPRLEAF